MRIKQKKKVVNPSAETYGTYMTNLRHPPDDPIVLDLYNRYILVESVRNVPLVDMMLDNAWETAKQPDLSMEHTLPDNPSPALQCRVDQYPGTITFGTNLCNSFDPLDDPFAALLSNKPTDGEYVRLEPFAGTLLDPDWESIMSLDPKQSGMVLEHTPPQRPSPYLCMTVGGASPTHVPLNPWTESFDESVGIPLKLPCEKAVDQHGMTQAAGNAITGIKTSRNTMNTTIPDASVFMVNSNNDSPSTTHPCTDIQEWHDPMIVYDVGPVQPAVWSGGQQGEVVYGSQRTPHTRLPSAVESPPPPPQSGEGYDHGMGTPMTLASTSRKPRGRPKKRVVSNRTLPCVPEGQNSSLEAAHT